MTVPDDGSDPTGPRYRNVIDHEGDKVVFAESFRGSIHVGTTIITTMVGVPVAMTFKYGVTLWGLLAFASAVLCMACGWLSHVFTVRYYMQPWKVSLRGTMWWPMVIFGSLSGVITFFGLLDQLIPLEPFVRSYALW